MTHLSYYTSGDLPDGATWSVYSELYANPEDDEPIDGTQKRIESGFPNMLAAEARASELYRSRGDRMTDVEKKTPFALVGDGTPDQIAAALEYAADRIRNGSRYEPLLDMTGEKRTEIGYWRFANG